MKPDRTTSTLDGAAAHAGAIEQERPEEPREALVEHEGIYIGNSEGEHLCGQHTTGVPAVPGGSWWMSWPFAVKEGLACLDCLAEWQHLLKQVRYR